MNLPACLRGMSPSSDDPLKAHCRTPPARRLTARPAPLDFRDGRSACMGSLLCHGRWGCGGAHRASSSWRVTLHARPIIGNVVHRDRAWSSVAVLGSQLIIAMAMLGASTSQCGCSASRSSRSLCSGHPDSPDDPRPKCRMRRLRPPSVSWQVEWPAWIAWLGRAWPRQGRARRRERRDRGSAPGLAMVGMFASRSGARGLVSEVSD